MNDPALAAVILAAGQGTRMRSRLAKVLHPLAGQPMVHYPAAAALALGAAPVVLVIGHQGEQVEAALAGSGVRFAVQPEQLGTGHALLCAQPALAEFRGDLLLLCGDVPLVSAATLTRLLTLHRREQAAVTVLTAVVPDPTGYGRILRNGDSVSAIVEEKDADPAQRRVAEINSGLYLFRAPFVFEALAQVGRDNAQGEFYLTDVVAIARRRGEKVCALAADPAEIQGVNDRAQLAAAGAVLRGRINQAHLLAGVTLVDPATTYIDAGVVIGPETVLHPGVHLRGACVIGRDCVIEPGVILSACRLADRVHVKAGSVCEQAEIGADSSVGPMAHLRPGTVLTGGNKIGNFVETKQALLGQGSQASHLTYIGDAEVGRNVNFGCGTITCNYDGRDKHRTVIEDDVFIGSDVQFVAPVRIGRNSLIGAGSTITKDVPPDALALTRAEQKILPGWALRHKKSKQRKTD